MRRLSFEEWKKRARRVHGNDRYDYSGSIFEGLQAPITIRCPTHGTFTQSAASHLGTARQKGRGCPGCGLDSRRATKSRASREAFIPTATEVHGGRYDYAEVDYANCDTPVRIHCPVHGLFEQTPYQHVRGRGCRRCAATAAGQARRARAATAFVERARARHGDRFDYANSRYAGSAIKVTIGCRRCGHDFEQTPANHLQGKGCARCAGLIKGRDDFVGQARETHGSRYDYAAVDYRGANREVVIGCPVHGRFEQLPGNHVKGRGCPRCARESTLSAGERRVLDWLETARIAHLPQATFETCQSAVAIKGGYPLRFDAALPEHRILVEYDGEGHFRPVEVHGGRDTLGARQANDRAKSDWAHANSYTLVRIPFFLDDLTDEILDAAVHGTRCSGAARSCIVAPRSRRATAPLPIGWTGAVS